MIELAEQIAGEITDPDDQTRALAAVAGALVAVDLDRAPAVAVAGQAEDTARTIPNLYEGAKAWAVTLPR